MSRRDEAVPVIDPVAEKRACKYLQLQNPAWRRVWVQEVKDGRVVCWEDHHGYSGWVCAVPSGVWEEALEEADRGPWSGWLGNETNSDQPL